MGEATMAMVDASARTSAARVWAACAALLVVVVLVYWRGLGGGFTFDDYPNLVFNTAVQVDSLQWDKWLAAMFSSPASDIQRPLAMLTFAINTWFTGLDPWAMKLTNVGVHGVNTVLVFMLVRALLRLSDDAKRSPIGIDWLALLVAAAWALHPINLMPVLFIVQRMEALSHTFVFAGLIAYLAGRRRQLEGRPGGGLIFGGLLVGGGLGVLAKESAVLLPLYTFLVEACLLRFRTAGVARDRNLMGMYALILALPAVVGGTWLLMKGLAPGAFAFREFTLGERLLTEARVVLDYLRWSVFPSLRELGLHHDDYPISRGLLDPPSTLTAILALAALVASLPLLRKWRPLTCLGIAWFLGAQLLTATVIPLELVFEHRNYFASLGVCIALADLLVLAPKRANLRKIGLIVAGLGVATFAMLTWMRADEWSHPVRFATSEAQKHPNSPRSAYTLAQTLVIASEYRKDSPLVPEAYKALYNALKVDRKSVLMHSTLFLLAANTGQPMEAWWWRDMQARLRSRIIGPQDINAISSLEKCARLYPQACNFPHEEMIATFEAAMQRGRNADVLVLYGSYLMHVMHDRERPLALWREAVELNPKQVQYRINLIKLLDWLGRKEEARAELETLRDMGHFNQYAAAIRELETRLGPAPSSVPVP